MFLYTFKSYPPLPFKSQWENNTLSLKQLRTSIDQTQDTCITNPSARLTHLFCCCYSNLCITFFLTSSCSKHSQLSVFSCSKLLVPKLYRLRFKPKQLLRVLLGWNLISKDPGILSYFQLPKVIRIKWNHGPRIITGYWRNWILR